MCKFHVPKAWKTQWWNPFQIAWMMFLLDHWFIVPDAKYFSAVDVPSSEFHLISSFLHEKRQCRIFKIVKSSAWILNVEHLELGPIITEHAQIAVAQDVEITTFKESRLTDSPYEIRTFVADENIWSILLQRSINEVPDRLHEVTPCSTDLFNRKRSTENRCCFAVYKFCKNSVWAPRRRVLCVSAIRTRVGSQSGRPEPPTKPTRKYANLAQLGAARLWYGDDADASLDRILKTHICFQQNAAAPCIFLLFIRCVWKI